MGMTLPLPWFPTMQPHYRKGNSPNCELPPVQSVTSYAFPAPPSRPNGSMQKAHQLQPLPQQLSSAPATSPYQRFYDSASCAPAESGLLSDAPPLGSAPGVSTRPVPSARANQPPHNYSRSVHIASVERTLVAMLVASARSNATLRSRLVAPNATIAGSAVSLPRRRTVVCRLSNRSKI